MKPLLGSGLIFCFCINVYSPAIAQLRAEKRADVSLPITLQPNQALLVMGFRRPDSRSLGTAGSIEFTRYDVDKRDLVFEPKNAKKNGDKNTYWIQFSSANRKSPLEYNAMVIAAGDYVLSSATLGGGSFIATKVQVVSFCLSAPVLHVEAGQVVYFGDVTPYQSVKMASGNRGNAMKYSANIDDARKALEKQGALATSLKPADMRNGAAFGCYGQTMLAYAVSGAPDIGPVMPKAMATTTLPDNQANQVTTAPPLLPPVAGQSQQH